LSSKKQLKGIPYEQCTFSQLLRKWFTLTAHEKVHGEALARLWDNMVDKKMYSTGGIGAIKNGKVSALSTSCLKVQVKEDAVGRHVPPLV